MRDEPTPPASTRRAPAWPVVLAMAAAFLVLAGGAYVWQRFRIADRTLARHRASAQADLVRLEAVVRTRPAIVAPVGEGTAEGVAARVEAAVASVPKEEREALAPWRFDDAAEPEEEDRILAAHPEALAVLDEILAVPATGSISRVDPFGIYPAESASARAEAGKWVEAALRRAISRGDGRTALLRIGQAAALGSDFERPGGMIARVVGGRIQHEALARLGDALAASPLDVEASRTLLKTLEVLDATRPGLADVHDTENVAVRTLLSAPHLPEDEGLRHTGWRHLWSGKLFRADALDEIEVSLLRLREVVNDPALDAERAYAEARRVQDEVMNPLAKSAVLPWPFFLRQEARVEAARRVGRTALAVALWTAEKGAPPAALAALVPTHLPHVPLDPYDLKPLRYAPGPPSKVWSVGADGHDDGGTPYADPDPEGHGGDVVIEVVRRGR